MSNDLTAVSSELSIGFGWDVIDQVHAQHDAFAQVASHALSHRFHPFRGKFDPGRWLQLRDNPVDGFLNDLIAPEEGTDGV
jgi:hypothetical protein